MFTTIRLFSRNPAQLSIEVVKDCLSAVDYKVLRVSRTVGAANYYAINRAEIAGKDVPSPPEDISSKEYTDTNTVARLYREGSFLSVRYVGIVSARLRKITGSIRAYAPELAEFGANSAGFTFGPLDLCRFVYDAAGNDDVELVAISKFSFFISSDDFGGSKDKLQEAFEASDELRKLRDELESLVGPLETCIIG